MSLSRPLELDGGRQATRPHRCCHVNPRLTQALVFEWATKTASWHGGIGQPTRTHERIKRLIGALLPELAHFNGAWKTGWDETRYSGVCTMDFDAHRLVIRLIVGGIVGKGMRVLVKFEYEGRGEDARGGDFTQLDLRHSATVGELPELLKLVQRRLVLARSLYQHLHYVDPFSGLPNAELPSDEWAQPIPFVAEREAQPSLLTELRATSPFLGQFSTEKVTDEPGEWRATVGWSFNRKFLFLAADSPLRGLHIRITTGRHWPSDERYLTVTVVEPAGLKPEVSQVLAALPGHNPQLGPLSFPKALQLLARELSYLQRALRLHYGISA